MPTFCTDFASKDEPRSTIRVFPLPTPVFFPSGSFSAYWSNLVVVLISAQLLYNSIGGGNVGKLIVVV